MAQQCCRSLSGNIGKWSCSLMVCVSAAFRAQWEQRSSPMVDWSLPSPRLLLEEWLPVSGSVLAASVLTVGSAASRFLCRVWLRHGQRGQEGGGVWQWHRGESSILRLYWTARRQQMDFHWSQLGETTLLEHRNQFKPAIAAINFQASKSSLRNHQCNIYYPWFC